MTEAGTITTMPTFCSIITSDTVAGARVLAAALRETHPEARMLALLGEQVDTGTAEPFEVLEREQLGADDGRRLADGAWIGEGEGPLQPRLLAWALANGADVAVYLDPQVCVYGSLEPVLGAMGKPGLLVTRRAMTLPQDGKRPSYGDLVAAGGISDALVAVTRGSAGEHFLEAWASSAVPSGPAPGRWLDLVSDLFGEAVVLDDPGVNVSCWNLHRRTLRAEEDRITVDGRPLRLFHFDGFRADQPYWLSPDANRVRVVDDPVLCQLCGEYAQRLREAGWHPPLRGLAGVERLGNGQRVDDVVRGLWRDAAAEGVRFGDPQHAAAADSFLAWMREDGQRGSDAGVNRYLLAAYRERPDLQRTFPDLEGADGPALLAWAWEHGRRELLPELLPASGDAMISDESQLGVNVVGYLRETLGLAEAARDYVDALTAAGVPVITTAIVPDMPGDAGGPSITRIGKQAYTDRRTSVEPAFNLICVNGDQLQAFINLGGASELGGRPSIGQWGWETDVLPPSWLPAFEHLDEIWVYTTFVAENLARLSPVPVVVVPLAISVPDVSAVDPGLARDDRFTFLSMLDMFSTLQRKNPVGLVRAFARAFAPDEGPRLLIKTINAQFRPKAADELRFEISDRPDITMIDSYLEPLQKTALLARADCYVSLHRSEGFGLPLAECMALGTPVIATGYSGNTDFMTPQNSWLVDWSPTRVGPDCEVYPPDGRWAEPDLDHAASLMRRVWEHPDHAAQRAVRARADIERQYTPKVVGSIARSRLERLMETSPRLVASASANGSTRLDAVARELSFDLRRGAPPVPGGPAGVARRMAFRLMSPFTYHERSLDRALFDAVSEVRADLDSEREQRRRDGERLRELERTLVRGDQQPSPRGDEQISQGGDRPPPARGGRRPLP